MLEMFNKTCKQTKNYISKRPQYFQINRTALKPNNKRAHPNENTNTFSVHVRTQKSQHQRVSSICAFREGGRLSYGLLIRYFAQNSSSRVIAFLRRINFIDCHGYFESERPTQSRSGDRSPSITSRRASQSIN